MLISCGLPRGRPAAERRGGPTNSPVSLARLGALLWLLFTAGCAATWADGDPGMQTGSAAGELLARQELVLREARQALARSAGDPRARLQLSRALFEAADLHFSGALIDWGEAAREAGPDELITADERLPQVVHETVARLCTEGLQLGEEALAAGAAAEKDQTELPARLLIALHLSLLSWSEGGATALFSGDISRLTGAMDELLADAPEFVRGAPLRLRGRFLTRAPWPLGDISKARDLLQRACGLSAVPINHLFLGDVLWLRGDQAGARSHWEAALSAEPDPETAAGVTLQRRLARQRLQRIGP